MTPQRMRLTLGALGTAVVIALSLFAFVLIDAQQASHDDIEGRLRDRAEAGASLISSVFSSSAASARANLEERYGSTRPPADQLARQAAEARNAFLVVAGVDGTIIAAPPKTPPEVAAALSRRPAWFKAAVAGQPLAVSDVADSAVAGTLTFAQAFRGTTGLRVLVSGSDPRLLAEFFEGSLKQLPDVDAGRTYLLDGQGAVLASTGTPTAPLGRAVTDTGVARALEARRESGDVAGDRYFATVPIQGTPWRVVVIVPRAKLFASVEGLNRWGPWALFVAFALAAAAAVLLVGRTIRDAAKITTANARLQEASTVLEDRAAQLAGTNSRLGQVNHELQRSNAELERFASIASHDLREPLRKVQMFSERIIHHESANLSERGRDYLDRMDTAAARMQTLIDGLLAYARVTSRMLPLEDVDLTLVAREVADDLEVVRREVDGTIEIGDLPHVAAEPLRMRQLLQNLTSNALRFRREGVPPVVRIDGAVEGDDVVLRVTDNGIGFDARHAERVFELFERLHARGDYPGTGMGLALCRRIVERHGGFISVQSTPGSGSTFTIRLPRHPPRPDPAQPSPPESDASPLVPS